MCLCREHRGDGNEKQRRQRQGEAKYFFHKNLF
jgi:hypothetical protein